jgi:hypothetical protein
MQGTSCTEWHVSVVCNSGITIQRNSSSFSLYSGSNKTVNIYLQWNVTSRTKHSSLSLIFDTVDSEILNTIIET